MIIKDDKNVKNLEEQQVPLIQNKCPYQDDYQNETLLKGFVFYLGPGG